MDFRKRYGSSSVEEIAGALYPSWSSYREPKELISTVNLMISAGSRYKNIDRVLGNGSYFVLGKDFAETTLTKVLPKSGTQFDNAMEILRNAEVPDLALKYKDLSAKLIEFELHRLTQSPTSMQVQDQVP